MLISNSLKSSFFFNFNYFLFKFTLMANMDFTFNQGQKGRRYLYLFCFIVMSFFQSHETLEEFNFKNAETKKEQQKRMLL